MNVESQNAESARTSVTVVISDGSVVKVSADQISCDLAGEAAILNLATGTYFGLDAVGARIWELIQQPKTVREIKNVILEEYEVEPSRCEADLAVLLGEMAAAGLVRIENGRDA